MMKVFLIVLSLFGFALLPLKPARAASALDKFHYVFIAGYKNEEIPGYFTENIRFLRDLGASSVSEIRPSSETAVLNNVALIRRELARLSEFENGKRPLLIIAHSKGGLESLHTLLRYPEQFTKARVALLVVVQSPLMGSPYTDHVMNEWDTSIYAWTPAYWYFRNQHQGFLSMMTETVKADWAASAAKVRSDQLAELSSRVLYLRSRKRFEEVSPSLKKSGGIVSLYGDNDGLVPTDHMLLPRLGDLTPFGLDGGVEDGIDHLDGFALGAEPSPERIETVQKFTCRVLVKALHVLNDAPEECAVFNER